MSTCGAGAPAREPLQRQLLFGEVGTRRLTSSHHRIKRNRPRMVRLFQSESHLERSIQFLNLGVSQGPNEPRQLHLAQTYQVVAQDPAFMFQPFIDTDRNLG